VNATVSAAERHDLVANVDAEPALVGDQRQLEPAASAAPVAWVATTRENAASVEASDHLVAGSTQPSPTLQMQVVYPATDATVAAMAVVENVAVVVADPGVFVSAGIDESRYSEVQCVLCSKEEPLHVESSQVSDRQR